MSDDAKTGTLYVGSLAKGLRLLRAFDETRTEMTLSELARKSGLDKSATQRLANTLHLEGFLDKDRTTRRFRPSLAWLEMAYAYYWSDPLVALAIPKLIDLSRQLSETVNLARLSEGHIVYVSRLPCHRASFAATIVGRKLPALGTAAGRAILSTWSEETRARAVADWPLRQITSATITDRDRIAHEIATVSDRGYAITHGQAILNEISIAAPLRDTTGNATAAVQCSVSTHFWEEARIVSEIVPFLTQTASSISPRPEH